MECIFCKIVEGDIPCLKVFEDDQTLAFMDINPVNPGHVLVIPKFHTPDIFEAPPECLSATMATTQRVARAVRETLDPHGMNIVQANGPGAQQSVFHLHFHVLPRAKDDGATMNWELVPGDMDELGKLAERIKANIR